MQEMQQVQQAFRNDMMQRLQHGPHPDRANVQRTAQLHMQRAVEHLAAAFKEQNAKLAGGADETPCRGRCQLPRLSAGCFALRVGSVPQTGGKRPVAPDLGAGWCVVVGVGRVV